MGHAVWCCLVLANRKGPLTCIPTLMLRAAFLSSFPVELCGFPAGVAPHRRLRFLAGWDVNVFLLPLNRSRTALGNWPFLICAWMAAFWDPKLWQAFLRVSKPFKAACSAIAAKLSAVISSATRSERIATTTSICHRWARSKADSAVL